jgi:ankyrin repeat protein
VRKKKKLMSEEMVTAYQKKSWRKVIEIIDSGESVDVYHGELGTPIISLAIQNGWNDLAYFLIENGADVNAKSTDSWSTALMDAAYNADLKMVKTLIQNGADVSQSTKKGMIALAYYVGMYGEDDSEIQKILTPKQS